MLLKHLYEYGASIAVADSKSVQMTSVLRLGGRKGVKLEVLEEPIEVDAPLEKRSSNVTPYTGYGTPEYVLGAGRPGRKDREGRSPFDAFWAHIEALCIASKDDDALRAVRAAVKDTAWLKDARRQVVDAPKANIVIDIGDEHLLERRPVKMHLRKVFKARLHDAEGPYTCMLSGVKCTPVLKHNMISGVPGTGGDVPFLSFNFPTARTQEHIRDKDSQGLNFPISQSAMLTYTSGFNALVRANLAPIGENTAVIIWGPQDAEHIVHAISPYTKKEARPAAWAAVSVMDSEEDCHCLFLKGAKGRISVLHYEVIPTSRVVASLRDFHENYGRFDYGWEKDKVEGSKGKLASWNRDDISIVQELERVGPDKKRQPLDAIVKVDAVRALLLGHPLPERMIHQILGAMRAPEVVGGAWHARAQLRWIVLHEIQKKAREKHHVKQDVAAQ